MGNVCLPRVCVCVCVCVCACVRVCVVGECMCLYVRDGGDGKGES
jgi:hypothetical protein